LLAALIEAPPPPHDTDCSGSLRQRVADAARAEGGRHALRAARLAAAMAARSEACAVSAGTAPGGDDVAAWAGCAWTAVCGLAAGCRAAATADAAAAVTRDVACAPRAAAALRDAARGAARRPDGKAATAAAAVALLAAGTGDDVAVLAAMRLGRSSTTQAAALAASLAACGAAPAARRALGAALDGGAAGSRRREAHACAQALFWAAPQQAAQALIATLPPPGAHPRAVAARAAVLEALATAAEAPCAAEAAASASAALAPSATSLLAAAAATQRQCDAARLAGALARLAAAHDDARAALRSAAVATLAASDASPCAVAAAATALYVSSSSDGGDAEDDAAALAATLAEEAGGCGSEGDDAQIVAARRGASYDTVAAALAHGSGAPPALRAALADAVVRHVASRYAAAGAAGGARLAFRFDAAFASGTAVPDGGKERQQPRCSDAFGPLTAALLRCAAPAGGNDARAKVLLAAMHAQCASACAVADTLGLPCAEAAQAADAAEAMTSSDAPDAGSPTAADAAAIAAVLALARPGSAAGGARPPWRALLSHGLAPALEAMAGALLAEPAAAASAATVLGCVGTARRGAPAAVAAASCAGVRLMSLHSALLELHGNAAAVLAAGGPACLPLPAALALLRAASACGDDVTAAAAAAASAWPLAARASCLSAAPSYQEAATWCAIAHNLVKAAEEDGSWENSTGDSGSGDDTSSYDVLPAPCALANGQACRCRGAAASAVMTSAKQPCLLQTAAASAMALFLSTAPPLGERAANSLKRQFAAPQGGKGRSKMTAGGGHASEVVVLPPPAVAAAPQGAPRRATRGGAAVAAAPEAGMTAASPAARALRVAAAACGLLAPDEPASAADKLRMGTLALLASAAAAAARRSEAQLFRGGRMEKDALSRLCSRCVPEPLARAAAYGALPATHPSIGSGLHGSLMAALSDVPITAAALCFAVLMAPPDALNTGRDDVAVREYVELLAVLLASAPGRGEAACVGTATAGPAHVVARLLSRGLARGGPATAQEQAALLPLLLGDADTRGLLAPPSLELTTGAASAKAAGGSTPGAPPPDRDEHPAEATWLTLGAEALAAVEATARGVTSFTCLGTCPPADVLLFGGPARVQATALAATVAHVTEQLRRFSTQHGPRAAAHAPGALEWAHCVAATSRAVLDALDAAPAQGNDAHADADDAPPEVVAAAALYTPLMAKTLADAAAQCMQAAAGMLQALPPHGADDDDVERDEPPEAAAARVAAAAAAAVAVARERATPPGGDVSPQPPGSPPLPSRSGAATPVLAPLREAAASKPVEDRHALLVQGAALHALGRRLAAHAERNQRKELRVAEDALVAAARAWAATARPPRPLPQHLRAVMRLAGRSGDDAAESPPEQPRAAKAKRRSSGKVKTMAAGRAQPAQAPEPEERGSGRKRRRGHGYLDAAGALFWGPFVSQPTSS
jgi:hypothetical protein